MKGLLRVNCDVEDMEVMEGHNFVGIARYDTKQDKTRYELV
jgi:hypothetical protein